MASSSAWKITFSPFVAAAGGEESSPLPCIVYVHGESYEWNSGNPYDGTVLASAGRVIVVTINFRLGVLGKYSSFGFLPFLSQKYCGVFVEYVDTGFANEVLLSTLYSSKIDFSHQNYWYIVWLWHFLHCLTSIISVYAKY